MATAKVTNVKGEVFAVNKEGVKRRLQSGDTLQEGEVLVTAPGSSAELDAGGGKPVTVPEQQTFTMDGAVGGPGAKPDAASSALESAAAAQKVVQALASGDANALLEAEAAAAGLAGGGGAEGGSSFVQLLRISEGVTPVSYEFGTFSQGTTSQPAPGVIPELLPTTPHVPTILVGNTVSNPEELPEGTPPGTVIGIFAPSAEAPVFEAALPGGSNAAGLGEFMLGQFLVSDSAGLSTLVSVTINGTEIPMGSLAGSVIPGATGTLTITSYDPTTGLANFTYELTTVTTDVANQPETDVFTFIANNGVDSSSPATVTIFIQDDVPAAVNDSTSAAEDTAVTVNVLTNDIGGADVDKALVSATLTTQEAGTVSVNTATGEVTFTPAAGFEGDATIDYTMRDADGDTSSAQLVVTVAADSTPTVDWIASDEGGAVVSEGGLPDGNLGGSTSTSGTLNITTGGDTINAVGGVTIDGEDVTAGGTVHGTYGDLVVTLSEGVYNWTYTLNDNAPHTNPDAVGSADQLAGESFSVVVTDDDGDSTPPSDLTIQINDDGPTVEIGALGLGNNTLTTQDAQTIGSASDTDSASFAQAFLDAVVPHYGADGAGSTVISGYTLTMNDTTSGLSSNGLDITLATASNGDVVGSTTAGEVFRLSVNASGSVTLTQSAEVDHVGEGNGEQIALDSGLVSLSATATTTDGDGDTATATVSADLGGNIRFDDDVPSVTANAVEDIQITLTTQDAQTIGSASDTDSASFAQAFLDAASPNYGADGPGDTVISGYTLSVADSASGLSSNGLDITLATASNGDVVGSTTAGEVFRLSVSASGSVTLTQSAEVDHVGEGNGEQIALDSGLVSLSATATTTDGDGDTATATVSADLGGNIRFDDDVPSVTANAVEDIQITLTTQDAQTIGSASDTDSASFASAFLDAASPNYGADGPGDTVISGYTLSVADSASGLKSNDLDITLATASNGDVVGSTTAGEVFRLSVNASGSVTLTQSAEVDHVGSGNDLQIALADGKVTLSATATTTDGDGDTATATVSADLGGNIRFDDDVPVAAIVLNDNVGVTHDETAGLQTGGGLSGTDIESTPGLDSLFSSVANKGTGLSENYASSTPALVSSTGSAVGADVPGTTTFLLGLNGNLAVNGQVATDLKTTDGKTIILTLEHGIVVGRADVDGNGSVTTAEPAAFAVAMSGTVAGRTVVAQYLSLQHPNTSDADDRIDLALPPSEGFPNGQSFLNIRVSLTDADGDTSVSAPVGIGGRIRFDDDGPTAVNDDNTVTEDATAAITGNVLTNDLSGADTPTSFVSWASTEASHGTFTDTGNGGYSYTLNNEDPLVQALDGGDTLTETFDYTMQDADGDESTATLTITINGANGVPEITADPGNQGEGDDRVYEAGLAAGSDAAADSEFATGTFTVSDPDGLADLVSVTINGDTVLVGSLVGHVFSGDHGTLTVDSFVDGVASYTYELTGPTTDGTGTETDVFTLTTSDHTATSAPATITIEIVDDVPRAVDDSNAVSEDATAAITGNVLSNDLHEDGQPGADTPTSFVSWASTEASHGTFTDTGNGGYSYTLNNDDPAVQALDDGETLTETFGYTMQDADDDESTATLTITINGTNDIAAPMLVVGSPDSDDSNITDPPSGPFTYPQGAGPGDITGDTGNDILIGDPGSAPEITAGQSANIVMVLDISGSMTSNSIPFGTGPDITRLAALKLAVDDALDSLYGSPGENVRVHIDAFASDGIPVGTFDLITGGEQDAAQLAAAKAAVELLTVPSDQYTNYEAGLQQAQTWIESTTPVTTTTTTDVTTQISSFDANSGADDDTARILGNGTTHLALVSGWIGTTNLQDVNAAGSSALDWGVEGGTADQLNAGEFLRFDFGAFNDFGNSGFYNAGGFSGVADVTAASFNLDDNSSGDTTFAWTIHFTLGGTESGSLVAPDSSNSVTLQGTGGNAGKEIAYIEFSIAGGTDGDVTLESVIQTRGNEAPLQDADVNKLVFISDGEPNRALNDTGGVITVDAQTAIDHILGVSPDGTNEVGAIESIANGGFTIEAIGINVDATALGYLSQVEGPLPGNDGATNIFSADELSTVLGELSGGQTLYDAAGNDVINGGVGNDLIFGDSLNTDNATDTDNTPLSTLPDGSGWQVFADLMNLTPPDNWSEQDVVEYINANQSALSAENGLTGGNDNIRGEAGNDTIYGQEGDDNITGGTGNDVMSGGTGADTFRWTLADANSTTVPVDHVTDFMQNLGDKLDLKDLLEGVNPATDPIGDYLAFSTNSTDTTITIKSQGTGGTVDQQIVLDGVNLIDLAGSSDTATIVSYLGTKIVID